jgi:hypothetical protein
MHGIEIYKGLLAGVVAGLASGFLGVSPGGILVPIISLPPYPASPFIQGGDAESSLLRSFLSPVGSSQGALVARLPQRCARSANYGGCSSAICSSSLCSLL